MLNPVAIITNKIVASFEVMFKTIDDGWAEAYRRMTGGKDKFEREFFLVDDMPVNKLSLSHDATVRQPAAASKKAKPDIAKMSRKQLRAHAKDLGVKHHHNLGDENLRVLIEKETR